MQAVHGRTPPPGYDSLSAAETRCVICSAPAGLESLTGLMSSLIRRVSVGCVIWAWMCGKPEAGKRGDLVSSYIWC
jgi:hypothetical protein